MQVNGKEVDWRDVADLIETQEDRDEVRRRSDAQVRHALAIRKALGLD